MGGMSEDANDTLFVTKNEKSLVPDLFCSWHKEAELRLIFTQWCEQKLDCQRVIVDPDDTAQMSFCCACSTYRIKKV